MKITIDGVEVDLEAIGIDFIPNSEQMTALEHLAKFMNDKGSLTTVLSGGAGTGKTSIVKIFLEYVRKKHRSNVRLVAPTHKAKAVLSRLSSNSFATTLHKLLGLKPNFNILEFDARDMKFIDDLLSQLLQTPDDLIIVDECSMINNTLYDLLVKKMRGKGKVLFLGDIKQIAPVKQGQIAKVFTKTDYPGFTLDKVERQQDSPLLETLVKLRTPDKVIYKTKTKDDKGLVVHDLYSFKETLSEYFFSLEVLNKAPQSTKILAYTNARVEAFNKFVRKLMGIDKKVLNKGETVIAYDSYTKAYEEVLFNGSEYIVQSVVKGTKNLPSYGLFDGYKVTLIDIHEGSEHRMFLLDPEASDTKYKNLGIVMENLRLKAIKRKYLWKDHFALTESFITMRDICYKDRVLRKKTIDYGYASTVHKSQSSTYTNVFVDMDNIAICKDLSERRQLEYVALSRPTHLAHILKK